MATFFSKSPTRLCRLGDGTESCFFMLKYLGIRHISPQNVASIVTIVVITKLTLLKMDYSKYKSGKETPSRVAWFQCDLNETQKRQIM